MLKTSTNPALICVNWPIPKVLAFSSTRLPLNVLHKSAPPFNDFNLGLHVGDSSPKVQQNRAALLAYLPEGTKIQWLNQVHGNEVAFVEEHTELPLEVDAAITKEKNIALSVMTADCLPIILADRNGNEVAVIHAGWRPLVKNIIANTVTKMDTPPEHLYAWLGPCISQLNFEVGAEVKSQFVELDASLGDAFIPSLNGKYLANLQWIANWQLSKLGISDIEINDSCTFSEGDLFYSYRRENKTGRMATIACLI